MTIEEHAAMGGLGGTVAQVMSAIPKPTGFDWLMLSFGDTPQQSTGSQGYFRQLFGLDLAKIAQTVREQTGELR